MLVTPLLVGMCIQFNSKCWIIVQELNQIVKFKETVPSPITRDYNYPGLYKPFDHQKTTAEFLSVHQRAFCFNEAGTGKTSSVIWATDYLMKQGKVVLDGDTNTVIDIYNREVSQSDVDARTAIYDVAVVIASQYVVV